MIGKETNTIHCLGGKMGVLNYIDNRRNGENRGKDSAEVLELAWLWERFKVSNS